MPLFSVLGVPHVRSRMYAEELEDSRRLSNHAALDEWVPGIGPLKCSLVMSRKMSRGRVLLWRRSEVH